VATLFEEQTFWLNVTNICLGLVTVAGCIMLAVSIVQELLAKRRERLHPAFSFDDHTFAVTGLGTLMADGGEPVDQEKK
jgi:hypothetical protein